MTAITARMVARLRAKTDAPMMECKKALTETRGDMEKAEEVLRVKLGSKAGKAASRVTAEGLISAHTTNTVGAMVEVNCETDFVTKNDGFIALVDATAQLVVKHNPVSVKALSALPCTLEGFGPTLEDVRVSLIGKTGENLSVRRFERMQAQTVAYIHNGRIGVLLAYEGDAGVAKDIAMHIAAMKPLALTSQDVPPALIEKERTVASAKAVQSGKPAEIAAKMIEGSVQKYLKEVSLLEQSFVKNDKQSVAQVLSASNTKVLAFKLYVVGEGIEKRQDDFAAEVAAQVAAAK